MKEVRTPSRTAAARRITLWLIFLVVALSLPLTYLLQAPAPVGTGLLRILGWGALIGAGAGAVVRLLCSPLFAARSWASRAAAGAGCIVLGALGGAGGGAWADRSIVVERQVVELPIVKVERLAARRRTSGIQISTLNPVDPTRQDHVAAKYIDGPTPRRGDCLTGTLERGWLGGAWVRRYEAGPCSKDRGIPGPYVLVSTNIPSSWRWHRPRNYRPKGSGNAIDDAVPPDLACRVRPGEWLYRCSPR